MDAQPNRRPQVRELSHAEFRKTPGYAELAEEYGIDPAKGWDEETCASLDDAAEFFRRYEYMRRQATPWDQDLIAAYLEGIALRHEAEPNAPVVLDRWGPVLVVQDPEGDCWQVVAAPADPRTCGAALAAHHAGRASPQ